MGYERLSAQDAALLCAQDPAAPLVIGAVARFDGTVLLQGGAGLDLARIRAHLDARLDRLPRFRQRLQTVAFDQGPPVWVDDADFDIANHVRALSLPRPASDRMLRLMVSQCLEEPLDPTGPPWEVVFVHGPERDDRTIEGDEVIAILKASHVMADGIALLGFAAAILDAEPDLAPEQPAHGVDRASSVPDRLTRPGAGRLWIETLVARGRHDVAALAGAAAAVTRPDRMFRDAAAIAREVAAMVGPAPALTISRPVGSSRDFAWLGLPLDDLHQVATREGTTLNDVVLSIVAAALEAHLELPRSGARTRGPHVLVPVSTHRLEDLDHLGNHFTMMITELPIGADDPVERLRSVHEATARSKASGQTAVAPLLFAVTELLPVRLLRRLGPGLIRRQPFANLAVTDMPGSPTPLYLLGAPLRELYPFISVTGNIGMIVGVLSYVDTLAVTVTVDAQIVPDLDGLMAAIASAADALLARALV